MSCIVFHRVSKSCLYSIDYGYLYNIYSHNTSIFAITWQRHVVIFEHKFILFPNFAHLSFVACNFESSHWQVSLEAYHRFCLQTW